jgi:hypothetical protein
MKKSRWQRKAQSAQHGEANMANEKTETAKLLELLERIALAVEHTATFYGFKPKPEPAAPATEEPAAPE